MAGSNLSQTFITHSDAVAAEGTIAKAQVGAYKIDDSDFATTALSGLGKVVLMQGTAGDPIQSPILDVRNIRRINYSVYAETEACKAVITSGALTANKVVTFRFVIKTAPTDYVSYFPDGRVSTLDGSTFDFPFSGFHANNHKVIPIDILTTGTLASDLARVATAVQAHPVLNAILKISQTTVANDTFTARHPGVNFDIAFARANDDDPALTYVATVSGFQAGSGNYWQVVGDELKTQYKNGSFNRTHIPIRPEIYTNPTYKYDKIVVEYAHNWPNSTGIAPAGEINQLVIYVALGSDAIVVADGQSGGDLVELKTLFGITALATSQEILFQGL
jgi:hypothetical protein